VVEPLLGVLGDTWKRWLIITLGGLAFALGMLLTGAAPSFAVLMLAFAVMSPASGAFVSLSQASLMDADPNRHEQQMARWNLAGSVGVVAGPLALGAAAVTGLGWRGLFLLFAALTVGLTALVWRLPALRANGAASEEERPPTLRQGLQGLALALRRPDVLRWLLLLEFGDLMLDVLLGFLALYFVDVVGVSPALAGTAVAVFTGAGLLGDALLIPLLRRVRGLTYVRLTALLLAGVFPVFLLIPGFWPKLGLLAVVGVASCGWYAVLQAQLYTALPGRSGTAMAVSSVFSLVTGLLPVGLGWVAAQAGLAATMWLLLLGPVVLVVGIPRLTSKTSVL
jgi:FSR family fosmidomycin resistance protein-like MFS transporter